jgi:hypothetical protein
MVVLEKLLVVIKWCRLYSNVIVHPPGSLCLKMPSLERLNPSKSLS